MKKRYCAFIMALCIICCTAQVALAKPQFTNFKQWFGKRESGADCTFIEFTVVDRNWEVANKGIYISLYDNKRRLIIDQQREMAVNAWRAAFGKRGPRVECTLGITLTDTGPNYNNMYFVKYSNGRYRVRNYVNGRHQIASYRLQW